MQMKKWLENFDITHLVLSSGKLVLQKTNFSDRCAKKWNARLISF